MDDYQALEIFLGGIYETISSGEMQSVRDMPYIPASTFTIYAWLVSFLFVISCLILQQVYSRAQA